jgi:predicted O-methyltransferase YrrM
VATATDEVQDTLDFLATIGGGPRTECEARVHYAMQVQPPHCIVELGVFTGQGLTSLACGSRFARSVPVIGIDLFGSRPSGQEQKYDTPENELTARSWAERFGVNELVTLTRSDTVEAARGWSRPIGLLVIDAGHEYEQVLADFQAWTPHLVPGGLLMMHDARNHAWPGIDRVIGESIRPTGEWEELPFVQPYSAWFRKRQAPLLSEELRRRCGEVHGEILPEEGMVLAALAAQVPSDRAIVEIGAYKGKSTCYLAAGALAGGGAIVYSIDLWERAPWRQYADPAAHTAWAENLGHLGLNSQAIALQADSVEASRFVDPAIGLLFLDAELSYEAVCRDIGAWARRVEPDGIMVFHDAATEDWGVARAIRDCLLKEGRYTSEIVHGCAVVRRVL